MSGILVKVREMSGKKNLVREKWPKPFIVSCILASINVFSRSLYCVNSAQEYHAYYFRLPALCSGGVPQTDRELSGNFTLSVEWSPCLNSFSCLHISNVSARDVNTTVSVLLHR